MRSDEQGFWHTAGAWLIYIAMSTLGALANYAEKVDKGERFSVKTFLLRWVIAAFASSMAGLYGESQDWDKRFIFMVCGVAGYMGVTAIKIGENLIKNRAGATSAPEERRNENQNGP